MNRNVLATLLLCLLMMSIGCAATQVKQTWMDETYRGGKPEKVLIIAMISTPTVQREIESQFVRRFRDRGITATESFRIISVDQLSAHDARDVVVAKVREMKLDAVLIIRRAAGRTTKDYIPGMTIEHGMGEARPPWSGPPRLRLLPRRHIRTIPNSLTWRPSSMMHRPKDSSGSCRPRRA